MLRTKFLATVLTYHVDVTHTQKNLKKCTFFCEKNKRDSSVFVSLQPRIRNSFCFSFQNWSKIVRIVSGRH